ncbi:hypothetical protein B4098_1893 [Heyndrickxia coagulans]|uniref:Uncharacterized protein n=1 Tax=Heyndrickxia coagulans TaxID=1398 RepID=A0A150K5R2_HEYCO|nr:hypothetical protein B4098_1893 [Heyndrickxia coagulans]
MYKICRNFDIENMFLQVWSGLSLSCTCTFYAGTAKAAGKISAAF